jgi:hypothetical protein
MRGGPPPTQGCDHRIREPQSRSQHLEETSATQEEAIMFVKAVGLFALAAIVGLYMGVLHSKGRTPPPVLAAVLHGILAVSAVVVLLLGVMQVGTGATAVSVALGLFVIAALGGLYLVSFHFRGKPLPGGVIVIHGMVAVIAFVILLVAVFALG